MNITEKSDTTLSGLLDQSVDLQNRAAALRLFINTEKMYGLEVWEQTDIREQLHHTESLIGIITRRIRRAKGLQK